MSFGALLSQEFQILARGACLDEKTLFNKLEDAFIFLSKSYTNYKVNVIHGATSFVAFDCSQNWVTTCPINTQVVKELADMMFVTYSYKKKICKLTYLQNKVTKSKDIRKFKGDLMQLSLLSDRPIIKPLNANRTLPKCAIGSRILKDAMIPSVGSYGVFYRNLYGEYEMLYYPADLLVPTQVKGKSWIRNIKYTGKVNTTRIIGGFDDCSGVTTLEDFGNELMNLRIGTPIDRNIHRALISYLAGEDKTIGLNKEFLELYSDDEKDYNRDNKVFEEWVDYIFSANTVILVNTDYDDELK